jgi:GNAT superfamily N-acetyltransferase
MDSDEFHLFLVHVSENLNELDVAVACHPDAERFILGWAAFASRCLLYCFVRGELRGVGIGSALLARQRSWMQDPGETIDYMIHTRHVDKLGLKARWDMRYAPRRLGWL